MGLISNKVDRKMLKPGDDVYSSRKLHSYSHHGSIIFVRFDFHIFLVMIFNLNIRNINDLISSMVGIYVEENRVIHFTGGKGNDAAEPRDDQRQRCEICGYQRNPQGGVVKSCVDCFLRGHKLYRFEYGVSAGHFFIKGSGTCSTKYSCEPDVVVERATRVLAEDKGFGKYDFFTNNSESFAVYCTTGEVASAQGLAAMLKVDIAVEVIGATVLAAALS